MKYNNPFSISVKLLLSIACLSMICLLGIGGGFLGRLARAEETPQEIEMLLRLTNWQDTVALPRFDPALGTLTGVELQITSRLSGTVRYENLDAVGRTLSLSLRTVVQVRRPNGLLGEASSDALVPASTTAFDGKRDFAGNSGGVANAISAVSSPHTINLSAPNDLVDFIGPAGAPGALSLAVSASGQAQSSGGGNVALSFRTEAGVKLAIRYLYTPAATATATSTASETPTSTETPTPTPTFTETSTETPTITSTPTPSTGKITIILDQVPDDNEDHKFVGDLGVFWLTDIGGGLPDDDGYVDRKTFEVAPGSYVVQKTVPSNHFVNAIKCTPPDIVVVDLATSSVSIRLDGGADIVCVFVSERDVQFQVHIYNDRDGNGEQNGSEPPLAGWTVKVRNTNTGAAFQAVTDSAGYVEMTKIPPPGTYEICEELQTGWVNTQPADAPCYTFTLVGGEVREMKFGNQKKTLVAGAQNSQESDTIQAWDWGREGQKAIFLPIITTTM